MGGDIMCYVEGCGRLARYKTRRLCTWHYNQGEAEEVKAHHQAMLQKYFPAATIS